MPDETPAPEERSDKTNPQSRRPPTVASGPFPRLITVNGLFTTDTFGNRSAIVSGLRAVKNVPSPGPKCRS